MFKKALYLLPLGLMFGLGCNSGDTPVETMPAPTAPPKTDTVGSAIQGNPNIPAAAKKGMLNGK